MDALAEELLTEDIGSIFIYTHEAHPGEKLGHHTGMEQKLEHARQFRQHYSLQRPLLADMLSGDCHRYFGSMPNMAWIISRSRQVLYRADWTSVESIRSCIKDLQSAEDQRRQSRVAAVPFNADRLEYRFRDRSAFIRHLEEIAGPRAAAEYIAEFGSE